MDSRFTIRVKDRMEKYAKEAYNKAPDLLNDSNTRSRYQLGVLLGEQLGRRLVTCTRWLLRLFRRHTSILGFVLLCLVIMSLPIFTAGCAEDPLTIKYSDSPKFYGMAGQYHNFQISSGTPGWISTDLSSYVPLGACQLLFGFKCESTQDLGIRGYLQPTLDAKAGQSAWYLQYTIVSIDPESYPIVELYRDEHGTNDYFLMGYWK